MPGLDQTGPDNKGPMTGRGLGRCARNAPPKGQEEQQDFGGGRLRGRGCGRRGHGRFRGNRNRFRD